MAHTILATDTPNCSAGYHPSSHCLRHSSSQTFFALGTFVLGTLRPGHSSPQTLFAPDALHPKHSSPWALFTLCPRLGELVRRPLVFAI